MRVKHYIVILSRYQDRAQAFNPKTIYQYLNYKLQNFHEMGLELFLPDIYHGGNLVT